MHDVTRGIWIVRTQKHLQEFSNTLALNYFDSTIIAGQCGRFLSRLRKLETIDFDKLKVMASDLGILSSQLTESIIPTIEKSCPFINVVRDNTLF